MGPKAPKDGPMEPNEFNLPRMTTFACCHRIRQDVLSKNFDLLGVFQGFTPGGYPFRADFMTFTRFLHERKGEFRIDITLFDEAGGRISDTEPRTVAFAEHPTHDLVTAWRVMFPRAGVYTFKVFANNLAVGEYKVFCR